MSNFVCLPDINSKMNELSGKHPLIIENGTTSSTDSTSVLHSKRKRNIFKESIYWSLEEEFIFFEAHSLLNNKWTKYSLLIPKLSKKMKEIKNHFHSCIIKTVRRIMNNKFDNSVKNIMRSVYSCFYLLTLESKVAGYSESQIVKINTKKHKYNPKLLIYTKQLTKEMIIRYYDILVKEYFLNNTLIRLILTMKRFKVDLITMNNITAIFLIVIKAKIIISCDRIINKKELTEENGNIIQKFIEEHRDKDIDYSIIDRIISINN